MKLTLFGGAHVPPRFRLPSEKSGSDGRGRGHLALVGKPVALSQNSTHAHAGSMAAIAVPALRDGCRVDFPRTLNRCPGAGSRCTVQHRFFDSSRRSHCCQTIGYSRCLTRTAAPIAPCAAFRSPPRLVTLPNTTARSDSAARLPTRSSTPPPAPPYSSHNLFHHLHP
jgi:hypothetical protein